LNVILRRTREVGVSLAVYDVIVPTMLHGLYVLDNFLDHAQTLERSKRMDPGTVLEARLAPDMLTFGEQFSVGCNKVEAHVVKLLGRDCPAPRAAAMMYPALKGRLVETRGFLQGLRPDEFDGAQSRTDPGCRARVVRRGRLHSPPRAAGLLLSHRHCPRHPAAPRRACRQA
jgi:hypothetical protein